MMIPLSNDGPCLASEDKRRHDEDRQLLANWDAGREEEPRLDDGTTASRGHIVPATLGSVDTSGPVEMKADWTGWDGNERIGHMRADGRCRVVNGLRQGHPLGEEDLGLLLPSARATRGEAVYRYAGTRMTAETPYGHWPPLPFVIGVQALSRICVRDSVLHSLRKGTVLDLCQKFLTHFAAKTISGTAGAGQGQCHAHNLRRGVASTAVLLAGNAGEVRSRDTTYTICFTVAQYIFKEFLSNSGQLFAAKGARCPLIVIGEISSFTIATRMSSQKNYLSFSLPCRHLTEPLPGMLGRAVLVLVFVASAISACDVKWPNGTDTKYNWWQCGGDISFTSAVPQFTNGTYEYPIHLNWPLIIMTDGTNPKNTYSSPGLKQNITVFQWAQYNSCSWSKLPTFGLLNNLDACTNGVNCPILPGKQQMSFQLDFSDVPQIIGLLTDDAPYELIYELYDAKLGEAVCLAFQARAYVH